VQVEADVVNNVVVVVVTVVVHVWLVVISLCVQWVVMVVVLVVRGETTATQDLSVLYALSLVVVVLLLTHIKVLWREEIHVVIVLVLKTIQPLRL
jgi:hypothetical protein